MIRKALALAVLVAATGSQFANAADGTINFNGALTAQTCTVAVNGVVTPTVATVTLPTVSTSKLAAAAQVEGTTGFTIQLSKCTGTANTAAAMFEPGTTVDANSGNLKNTTGTATNVQLQLVDAVNNTAIKAGAGAQRATTSRSAIDSTGAANMNYAVQYYATGASTPGSVISSVTYSIDYQ
ncbi:fimbrial protein [Pseudomonas sp. L1(2025)]|uniref:fimbrial protein n=1 Tax=Pseudomonas sp. L1(2025) TaxID=3449429 RepID=UPI003F68F3A0